MIETPKTPSSIRDIPLTPEVIELLRKHKGQITQGFSFTTDEGKSYKLKNKGRTKQVPPLLT